MVRFMAEYQPENPWCRLSDRKIVPCFTFNVAGMVRIFPGLGYVVNNHGDGFRPLRIGLWDPFQMAELLWLLNGGDPNHLHPLGAHPPSKGVESIAEGAVRCSYFCWRRGLNNSFEQ